MAHLSVRSICHPYDGEGELDDKRTGELQPNPRSFRMTVRVLGPQCVMQWKWSGTPGCCPFATPKGSALQSFTCDDDDGRSFSAASGGPFGNVHKLTRTQVTFESPSALCMVSSAKSPSHSAVTLFLVKKSAVIGLSQRASSSFRDSGSSPEVAVVKIARGSA